MNAHFSSHEDQFDMSILLCFSLCFLLFDGSTHLQLRFNSIDEHGQWNFGIIALGDCIGKVSEVISKTIWGRYQISFEYHAFI